MTYQAKVIAGGKIVIPAELRRDLGIKDGDSLVVERAGDGTLTVKTYAQVVHEVQETARQLRGPASGSVVDELLAERRAGAAREDEASEAWLAAHPSPQAA